MCPLTHCCLSFTNPLTFLLLCTPPHCILYLNLPISFLAPTLKFVSSHFPQTSHILFFLTNPPLFTPQGCEAPGGGDVESKTGALHLCAGFVIPKLLRVDPRLQPAHCQSHEAAHPATRVLQPGATRESKAQSCLYLLNPLPLRSLLGPQPLTAASPTRPDLLMTLCGRGGTQRGYN